MATAVSMNVVDGELLSSSRPAAMKPIGDVTVMATCAAAKTWVRNASGGRNVNAVNNRGK